MGRDDLEAGQLHGIGGDVAVHWPPLDHKARKLAQRRLTQIQGPA
jgi:hypothetical protein